MITAKNGLLRLKDDCCGASGQSLHGNSSSWLAKAVRTAGWAIRRRAGNYTVYLNNEPKSLRGSPGMCEHLMPGGRLAVISFHSLEDRIVKHFMRDTAEGDKLPRGVPIRASEVPQGRLHLIGKAMRATGAEVRANPRARSAVMRVAERSDVA